MATTTQDEYLMSQFQQLIDLGDSWCVNFGDPYLYRLLRQLTQGQYMTWEDGDKFPAASFRYYGTVSLWWVIVIYNGIVHPMEVDPGDQIFIPDGLQINAVITAMKQQYAARRVITI